MSDNEQVEPTVIRRIVEKETGDIYVSMQDIIAALRASSAEYKKYSEGDDENSIAAIAIDHVATQLDFAMIAHDEGIREDVDVQSD